MKEIPLIRTAAGVGIILVGAGALLGALNIINFNDMFANYWPVLLLAAAVVLLVDNARQNYSWAILLTVVGVLALLNSLEVVSVNFWQLFWPLVLIVVGWTILTQRARLMSGSTDNITAILGGSENKNSSKDFKSSNMTSILGGSSIDLTKAKIKKQATIDVLTIMGGSEIRVPESWQVRVAVTPILGGVENKTISPSKADAPVLNITGTTILGGIEIKN